MALPLRAKLRKAVSSQQSAVRHPAPGCQTDSRDADLPPDTIDARGLHGRTLTCLHAT